jgi:hypothetical protein
MEFLVLVHCEPAGLLAARMERSSIRDTLLAMEAGALAHHA